MRSYRDILLLSVIFLTLDLLLRYPIIFDAALGLLTVGLLVWGRKTAPLFFALALAVNLYTGASLLSAILLAFTDLALSAGVAWLVTRFLSYEGRLSTIRDLVIFMGLVCPIMGVTGALARYQILQLLAMPLEPEGLIFVVVEALAVLFGFALGVPLGLSLFDNKPPWKNRLQLVGLPTLFLIFFTFFGREVIQSNFERSARMLIQTQARLMAERTQEELLFYERLLRTIAAYLRSHPNTTQEEFEKFAASMTERGSMLIALQWIPRNRAETDSPFLYEAIPGTGAPGKTLQAEQGWQREITAKDAITVKFPSQDNKQTVRGRFYMILPLDFPKAGYVVGEFSTRALVETSTAELEDSRLMAAEVYNAAEGTSENLLFRFGTPWKPTQQTFSEKISVGDSIWTLRVPVVVDPNSRPKFALPMGLFILTAVQFFLVLVSDGQDRIKKLNTEVQERALRLEKMNDELAEAHDSAQSANEAKSLFLANMSHEIRTPMNGILGLIRLLLESELRPAQEEQLHHVLSSADSLMAVLDEILDFSKAKGGALKAEPSEQNLASLLERAVRTMILAAEEKGLTLLLSTPLELPENVTLDGDKLYQVLLNLLGNAIKFTETGEVELKVEVEPAQGDKSHFLFTVRDTGPGIPSDQQAKIFEAFTQVASSDSADSRGAGLGLAISQRLVNLMGGKIAVTSSVNEGATFSFSLLCESGPLIESSLDSELKPSDYPALVALRSQTLNRILEQRLRYWGFPLVSERSQAKLIVGDERLLNQGSLDSAGTIICLDASRFVQLYDSCLSKGAVTLAQPISTRVLQEAIETALLDRETPARKNEPKAAPSRDFSGLTALIADDNYTNRLLASLLLKRQGFEVILAEDGQEAVEITRRMQPDVILMDIRMPRLNGYEATRKLRSLNYSIPVIAATAHSLEATDPRLKEAGLNGLVKKPVSEEKLRSVLNRVMLQQKPYSLTALMQSVGQSQASARAVIHGFLDEADELSQALAVAADKNQLSAVLHAIRGTVGIFEAKAVLNAIDNLEKEGLDETLKPEVQQKLAELAELLKKESASLS